MLPGLGFGMKYQLVVSGTQGYLYVLVQLDFELPRIYMVELHQGPAVGLVGAIWKHAPIFHMHFHTVKLHPVADANIYCYIFDMMNLFKIFLKHHNLTTPNGQVPADHVQIQIDSSVIGSIVISPEAPHGNLG